MKIVGKLIGVILTRSTSKHDQTKKWDCCSPKKKKKEKFQSSNSHSGHAKKRLSTVNVKSKPTLPK